MSAFIQSAVRTYYGDWVEVNVGINETIQREEDAGNEVLGFSVLQLATRAVIVYFCLRVRRRDPARVYGAAL